jgi:hypothetical protein
MNGLTPEEVRKKVEDGELTTETIANTLAAEDVNADMKKAMEGTVKVMERVAKGKSDKEVNEIKSLMTDRGEGMNMGAMKDIQAAGGVEAYLKQQGFSEQDAIDMGYASWDEYVKAMESNYKTGTLAFEDATAKFQKMGISASELPDQLTAGLADGLAEKLSLVAANQGPQMAKDVLAAYNGITEGMDTE